MSLNAAAGKQATSPKTVLYWYDGTTFGGIESALLTFFKYCDFTRVRPVLIWAGVLNDPRFVRDIKECGVETFQLTPADGSDALDRVLRVGAIAALLRRVQPALVHIHSSGALTHGALIAVASILGIPVVRTVHMPFSRWLMNASVRRHAWQRAVHRLLGKGVARAITVSAVDRTELIRTGLIDEANCVSIPNGIILEAFDNLPSQSEARKLLGVESARFVIGGVGRLAPQKGFERLVAAMPHILRVDPDVKLLLLGSGAEEKALGVQIDKLGLGRSVRLIGQREDVPRCLPAFDVFVIPSVYESQGIVFLEGMAAGIPIVASDLECFRELLGDSGAAQLVDSANPTALATMISALISDPALRRRMGESGRQRIGAYAGRTNFESICAVYDQLSGRRRLAAEG
jgi:glycosyltransferase involved in cell wall biosynthesis